MISSLVTLLPERDKSRRYNKAIQNQIHSPEAFADALAKGVGRAMLALRAPGGAERHGNALIEACVENKQFDRQCESGRAPYLMHLVRTARLEERALVAILDALPRSEEDWDRDQMIGLLGEYVARGEERAWDVLVRLSQDGNDEAQDALAESSERGLAWVAEHILPGLPFEERWRLGMWLPDDETDDRTETQRRLREVQKVDEAKREATPKRKEPAKVEPRAFLDGLESTRTPWEKVRDFVRNASKEEFLEAAERLLYSKDRRVQTVLRRVFREVPFPLPLERLFGLVDEESHRYVAVSLLGRIDDPAVRTFALERLRRDVPDWNASEMLRASFRSGDEAAIWAILQRLLGEEAETQHGVVLDLAFLMFARKEVDWQPFAEWAYEHNPCSFCRGSAVRWMAERGSISSEILQEGIYDGELDIRELCGAGAGSLLP